MILKIMSKSVALLSLMTKWVQGVWEFIMVATKDTDGWFNYCKLRRFHLLVKINQIKTYQ